MKAPHTLRALPKRHQRGISMIEVLVGVLLISVGLLGLITLQARAIQFSTDSEDTTRAALLANEMASLMWANKTITVPGPQYDAWQTAVSTLPNGLPGGLGVVTPESASTAKITITWIPTKGGGENKYVTDVVIVD